MKIFDNMDGEQTGLTICLSLLMICFTLIVTLLIVIPGHNDVSVTCGDTTYVIYDLARFDRDERLIATQQLFDRCNDE